MTSKKPESAAECLEAAYATAQYGTPGQILAVRAAIDAAVETARREGIAEGSECTASPGCCHPANYCDGCHEKFAQAREQAAFRRGAEALKAALVNMLGNHHTLSMSAELVRGLDVEAAIRLYADPPAEEKGEK